MKKIIKRTENFSIYEDEFNGITQTFRHWTNDVVEIQFNDNFAKANGYKSLDDLLTSIRGFRDYLALKCGNIPQWITITRDG